MKWSTTNSYWRSSESAAPGRPGSAVTADQSLTTHLAKVLKKNKERFDGSLT